MKITNTSNPNKHLSFDEQPINGVRSLDFYEVRALIAGCHMEQVRATYVLDESSIKVLVNLLRNSEDSQNEVRGFAVDKFGSWIKVNFAEQCGLWLEFNGCNQGFFLSDEQVDMLVDSLLELDCVRGGF